MNVSDSKREFVRELAQEILEARNDDEFNEGCRAIVEVIREADLDREE